MAFTGHAPLIPESSAIWGVEEALKTPPPGHREGGKPPVWWMRSGVASGVAVRVEAEELAVLRTVHLCGVAAAEAAMAVAELLGEDVGHRDQFDGAVLGAEGIFGGACATSAATDERELDGVVSGGMDVRQ